MKKLLISLLLIAALAFLWSASAFAQSGYRPLQTGDTGEDVRSLKTALYKLGYFNTQNLSDQYSETTAQRVALFQKDHGLQETGQASPELQAYVFALLRDPSLTPFPEAPAATPAPANLPSPVPTFEAAASPAPYRTLQEGDSGQDVTELKHAMYALGYFSTTDVNDRYNSTMVERIRLLQKNNGLRQTGIADPELQALIYSGNCVKTATAPTPTPVPLQPNGLPGDWPGTDEAGFLIPTEDMREYVYQNDAEGLWIYLSPSLAVEIRQYEEKKDRNVWYECDIRCSPESPLTSFVNWNQAENNTIPRDPMTMARDQQSVLLLSDDHFGARLHARDIMGVCIRNGRVISEETYAPENHHFPNLDTLSLLPDGSLRADLCAGVTAQELVDQGVKEALCFGPVLVRDGAKNELILNSNQNHYRNPRTALGMIGPYHYFALVVNGRGEKGQGVILEWLADKMLEKGVTEAINLDGGGTTSLVFLGRRLNHSGSDVRYLYSCIAFGTSESVI